MLQVDALDISVHNGIFNWQKAVDNNVKAVIIKASQRDFADPLFMKNVEAAKKYDLQLGAFHFLDYTRRHYTEPNHAEFGKLQARKFLEMVLPYIIDGTLKITLKDENGKVFDATLWYDLEIAYDWEKLDYPNLERALKIADGFVNKVKEGVKDNAKIDMNVGQYGSGYTFQIDSPACKHIPPWLAWYQTAREPSYSYRQTNGSIYFMTGVHKGNWLLHQFSSTGDGKKYGNAVGCPYIDLNRLNPKYTLVKKTTEPHEPQPTTKKWSDLSIEEKLNLLKSKHPEIA